MQVDYSDKEKENLFFIAKEIANKIRILKDPFNELMSISTRFIHIKNMDLASDYKGIGTILNTTFHTRNDKKTFEIANMRYCIGHQLYVFMNVDYVQFTIEIMADD